MVLATMVLALVCMPVFSYGKTDADMTTVKVGLTISPGYVYKDSKGIWRGIDVEFVENIAQTAGFKVKIVPVKNESEAENYLESGKIDVMGDISKTAARKNRYLFSEYAQGSISMAIIVRKNDNRYEFNNTSQIGKMKLATFSEGVHLKLEHWCRQQQITPSIVKYVNDGALKALDSGRVDGVAVGTEYIKGYSTIAKFSPTSYYFVFSKNKKALKNKFDVAMSQILVHNPYYYTDLKNSYLSQEGGNFESLTAAEDKYVKTHRNVKVAVLSEDQPYYSAGLKGDKGILPDYYAKLSQETGLKFKFVPYETQKDAINAVKTGKADIIGIYSSGLISAHAEGLYITSSYSEVGAVIVRRSGVKSGEIRKIAIKERTRAVYANSSNAILKNAELVGYDNARECFEALRNKKVDAMVTGLPSATWIINQTNASTYSITPLQNLSINLCGAVANDNGTLCSIMNKGIYACGYSFDGIVTNDTMQESGIRTFVARIPAVWIMIFAAFMLAIVAGLITAMVMLRRRQREKLEVDARKMENDRREMELAAVERGAEEKNQFFSTISHDMRTPLNAIIGFSEIAINSDLPPETEEYLKKIRASGKLLHDMIDDTLTVSKMSSGKLELENRPLSIDNVIEAVVEPIRAEAEEKRLNFTVDDSGLLKRTVLADRLYLQKIVLNLLSNAVKYTDEGGNVSLVLKDEAEADGSVVTTIVVKDDGIGIADDFMQYIYEPFTQEGRNPGRSSGTGLGLSIVKRLVELMGGTIGVESRENVGTTFTVKMAFADARESGQAQETLQSAGEVDLEGRRVLLCEDNALNQEIAVTLLEEKGMIVDVAENGRKGLEKFLAAGAGSYDVILMDLRMPVMDGYEAARGIRTSGRADAATVPILAMSADAFEDDVRRCRDAGMSGHIGKPVDVTEMYRKISKILK